MQKIIEELQYVADRLVERGFAKDDRIVLVLAQAIDGLKQQSCKAGVSRPLSDVMLQMHVQMVVVRCVPNPNRVTEVDLVNLVDDMVKLIKFLQSDNGG